MSPELPARPTGPLILSAALILLITMGSRQSIGLFVSPMNTTTGLGIVGISFAIAIGQFIWGLAQPVFGIVADRYGPGRVIVVGGILLALGWALTTLVSSQWMLIASLGFLVAAGAGGGSFSVLIGATAATLPAHKRSFAAGLINAGGSLGQFVFAPLCQMLIAAHGWMAAMLTLSVTSLLTLPLASVLRRRPGVAGVDLHASTTPALTLREQLRIAGGDRSYWLLHAGFLTCGFHIAFLVTHLPGEVGLCGLPAGVAATSLAIIGLANVVGSLAAGTLGNVFRMKWLLAAVYLLRAVAIAGYMMAPKSALTFYVFAAVLGVTWLSTVPPTAGLVAKLFGTRYLATLFGLTLLSHQIGGFFGAWLGGLALAGTGNYTWMWVADIGLALAAALFNLPIREAAMRPERLSPTGAGT